MTKKNHPISREEKTLSCACGRMSYRVAQECGRVVCFKCLLDKAGGHPMKSAVETVKENVVAKQENSVKTENKKNVNPIDPVTGKRRRGRPAKVKTEITS